ncbi:ROK family transcriptional regulator [Rhodoferax lacus]|uniref:ROK family transcriptional regulator n=1 Tax=Rhodoferax lacus TaxID=2184758 RepID=A0A3E1RC97_9BURK|nr:ROK family transcriptional regulator [Rhodoferax lacus]RFO96260.1 ROK family transcriptional regulator [Rhodoferax lacus]
MKATGDLQLLKRINRSVLLRLIRSQPDLSRARLAHLSGLTKSTVSALVRELLDEHWLSEAAAPVATQGLGRPSTPLNIDTARRVLIGIEIAVDCLRLVCVSLSGVILTQTEVALDDPQPQAACQQLGRLVQVLCQQLEEKELILSGVGVCLPGAVDESLGLVRLAPNLGWRDVPFRALVSEEFARLGIATQHIHLQNDADAAALGEYEFAGGSSDDPLIFVNCDVGVGAGIVLNDRLFTGFLGAAGEIGHSILQVDGPLCSCGRRGCAEAFIGARALAKKQGLQQAGQYLGVLLQNLDAMFNPRVIVVGGRSCIDHPTLIDSARSAQQVYARAAGLQAPQIRAARFGVQAAAVGAAALVLHQFLRPLLKETKHVPGN